MRAPLPEVLAHPWMTRSFSGAPDPHLVHREPLRPDDLDSHVLRAMTGFEFGTPEDIQRRLAAVLESDTYVRAVHAWQQRRTGGTLNMSLNGGARSSSTFSFDSGSGKEPLSPSKATPKKRFSGFEFYRRKLFSPSTSPPSTPISKSPSASGTTSALSLSQVSDGLNGLDPTRGFHPLISIYYLVREKQERERVYGPGYFASSQLSLQTPQHHPVSKSSHGSQDADGLAPKPPPASFKPPTIRTTPSPSIVDTHVLPPSQQQKADYGMPLPLLPAPESSHYSGLSYDTPATLATPSPTHATFVATPQTPQPQPRARDVDLGVQNVTSAGAQPPTTPVTGTMPRAPPVSTHRRSHSLNQRPSVTKGWAGMMGAGTGTQPAVEKDEPRTAGPEMTQFHKRDLLRSNEAEPEPEPEKEKEKEQIEEKQEDSAENMTEKERERERARQRINGHTNGSGHERAVPDNPPPIISAGATLARKFGSLLVGSRGDGHERRGGAKRASILGMSPRISGDSEKEKEKEKEKEREKEKEKDRPLDEKVEPREHDRNGEEKTEQGEKDKVEPIVHGLRESFSQPLGSIHRRAATVLDPSGRAARHERRSSTGASAFVGGTVGRKAKPPSVTGTMAPSIGRTDKWRTDIPGGAEGGTDQKPGADEQGHAIVNGHSEQRKEEVTNEKDFKPVFLKGLFRWVTLTI